MQTPGDLSLSAAHELGSLIERFTGTDGVHTTSIPRVFLLRSSHPTEQLHAVQEPAICIVAQGRKQVMAGTSVYLYDRAKYLIASVDIPIVGQILEASPAAPYLCLRLDLDPSVIGALMLEAEVPKTASDTPASALSLSTVTPELLDAAIRLVRLLTAPRDIPILAPLAEREILYRLLLGDQSSKLRQIAVAESKLQQINRAIGWIKRHFRDFFQYRRRGGRSPHEPIDAARTLQGRDIHEPSAIPEAVAAAGSAPAHSVAVARCGDGRPFRGL